VLNHGLQVNTIIASKCISKLFRLRALSASLCLQDLGLQVHLFVQLNLGLEVHFQSHSITATKAISKFTRLQPPSFSLRSPNWRLKVCVQFHSCTVCSQIDHMYIYKYLDRQYMPYHDVMNLMTVAKMNMIDEMTCGYRTLRNYCCENMAPSLLQTFAKVSVAPKFDVL
jgi:hypothetical protein